MHLHFSNALVFYNQNWDGLRPGIAAALGDQVTSMSGADRVQL